MRTCDANWAARPESPWRIITDAAPRIPGPLFVCAVGGARAQHRIGRMQSLWMIVAAFLFSIMGVFVKLASSEHSAWEILF